MADFLQLWRLYIAPLKLVLPVHSRMHITPHLFLSHELKTWCQVCPPSVVLRLLHLQGSRLTIFNRGTVALNIFFRERFKLLLMVSIALSTLPALVSNVTSNV